MGHWGGALRNSQVCHNTTQRQRGRVRADGRMDSLITWHHTGRALHGYSMAHPIHWVMNKKVRCLVCVLSWTVADRRGQAGRAAWELHTHAMPHAQLRVSVG